MKAFPVSKPSSYTDEPYFETCTHPIAFLVVVTSSMPMLWAVVGVHILLSDI